MKRLIITLLAGANVCTILALWAVCASTWLHPALCPRLAQAGLLMPLVLTANLGFIVLWFIVDLKGLFLPLVGILPVTGFCLDYCPLNFTAKEVSDDSAQTLRVATFNSCGWHYKDSTDGEWNAPQLLRLLDADILCMQETSKIPAGVQSVVDSLGYDTRQSKGTMICSRLPFIGDSIPIGFIDSTNGILVWRVRNGEDTLTVICAHLESNGIPEQEKTALGERIHAHNEEELKESGRVMLSFLSASAAARARQTDRLDSLLTARSEESIILCGDLNDTPVSYTYRRIKQHLNNCYRESGFGPGFSYNRTGFWVRIDHIFTSDDWTSFSTRAVHNFSSSDHYPVLTTLRKKNK
jgi:endonuclease/exonuclease/phosphatase family metal-dependent hydrolase